MELILKAKDIRVEFKGRDVLDINELEVYDYDRIGLVGANGAGKSTLLRVLLGELTPPGCKMNRLGELAKITVAAPIPVTGESALAGIYYSLEANGAKVPQANKDLAQEELKALSDINAENKDKSGYDANKLNVALADIKAGIAKAKEAKGNLTEEDVRKIVEDTLKNYKLDQVITGNQVNIIINFALNLSKSDILNNADFTKTLNDLKESIVSQAGDSFKNINLNFDANKALEEGGNFFSSLWQAIVNFFKSFGA